MRRLSEEYGARAPPTLDFGDLLARVLDDIKFAHWRREQGWCEGGGAVPRLCLLAHHLHATTDLGASVADDLGLVASVAGVVASHVTDVPQNGGGSGRGCGGRGGGAHDALGGGGDGETGESGGGGAGERWSGGDGAWREVTPPSQASGKSTPLESGGEGADKEGYVKFSTVMRLLSARHLRGGGGGVFSSRP